MKLLLHSCCGPCSIAILDKFAKENENTEITSFFYNPNIHPFTEHRARKEAWLLLMKQTGTPYICDADYPLEQWLAAVAAKPDARCDYCYEVRLRAAAQLAMEAGFEQFTTSLLISPYQKHDRIRQIGESLAEEYGVKFYYEDFRSLFRHGQAMAREAGLYMQKYCGCIYSEKERYCKQGKVAPK